MSSQALCRSIRGHRVGHGMFSFRKGTCFTGFQKLMRVESTEELDQLCDHAGPTGLVACPEARAIIAVEVFVEEDVVLPMRIRLEFFGSAIDWPPARLIAQKDVHQTIGDILSYLVEVHQFCLIP